MSLGLGTIFGGVSMILGAGSQPAFPLLAGWAGAAAGTALVLGILTPIAGLLQAALSLCGLAMDVAGTGVHVGRQLFMGVEPALLSITIFLLGPGAFSLDAVLFGRREIVIPAGHRRLPGQDRDSETDN